MMNKVSLPVSNAFCPQCLFLYGTYKDDNTPNYGLFCWATYCADEALKFVACIGEDKLTRDRIKATGVFSASVVNKPLLLYADFFGNNSGYVVDKSKVIESIKGMVLNVPIPKDSVWSFELEVDKTLYLDNEEKSEIYICNFKNVLADERLADESLSFEDRLRIAQPLTTMSARYFSVNENPVGQWGQWKNL